ncbi:hypothetical protein QL285_014846 [Trifolium repens]|nr:hypothetical protein QL285_014846 [Trifolium repens]
MIPLKRKKPEPIIPFKKNHPFFNSISEPNLELLDIAISISLKRLKSMEKEVLVFPLDVDAEIRELEYKFSESLRLLGGYVKNKIQGRGMNALNQIMAVEELSHAPRLTNFNHEEECAFQEELLVVIRENIEQAIIDAKKQEEEEAEQARIAAEAELKRLPDEEALKVLVDRVVRIAEVESQKLAENLEMGPQQGEDTIMHDQDLDEKASDKGKNVIVDFTPPNSPVRLITGSLSSAVPPAVQIALDEMKNEMKEELRNEIDELRADMRADMNASGEATHEKIDEMMLFLQNIASQLPKP